MTGRFVVFTRSLYGRIFKFNSQRLSFINSEPQKSGKNFWGSLSMSKHKFEEKFNIVSQVKNGKPFLLNPLLSQPVHILHSCLVV